MLAMSRRDRMFLLESLVLREPLLFSIHALLFELQAGPRFNKVMGSYCVSMQVIPRLLYKCNSSGGMHASPTIGTSTTS